MKNGMKYYIITIVLICTVIAIAAMVYFIFIKNIDQYDIIGPYKIKCITNKEICYTTENNEDIIMKYKYINIPTTGIAGYIPFYAKKDYYDIALDAEEDLKYINLYLKYVMFYIDNENNISTNIAAESIKLLLTNDLSKKDISIDLYEYVILKGYSKYDLRFGKAPTRFHKVYYNAEKEAKEAKSGRWSKASLLRMYKQH